MDRTHLAQRRFKRHLPYILAAMLLTLIVSVLYFKWYDFRPIQPKNATALERLMAGNNRFAQGHPRHPDESVKHRHKVATGQHPFALVVTCSDSRLSPELIFDQGLGDLFVIRTAGNLLSDMELGSIEYAVEHLGVETIVVMGHEHCGAIEALMSEEPVHGHVQTIIDSLQQEVEIKEALVSHDAFSAVLANIQHQVSSILHAPLIIQEGSGQKKVISVHGVVYSMENGKVTLLDSSVTRL